MQKSDLYAIIAANRMKDQFIIEDDMAEIILTIKNKVGLHARPASLFVQAANKFKSDIRITNIGSNVTANAKSILNVLTLGANQGCEIRMNAEGEDADQALAALKELFDSNFGENE